MVDQIVVGDIVLLKAGDKVPADLRIIEADKLYVDNSSLTGESQRQLRTTECTNPDPTETSNLAFLGTLVVEGSGAGVVIRTGDASFMGRIANLTSEVDYWQTPLSREIAHFIHAISIAALIIGFTFFLISLLYGHRLIDSIIFLISILVAKVPEGLLATITVALTLIAKRMSKKNCLVKNLEAVETLGSTTVICSDKTGTLTQNKMTVSNIWLNDRYQTAESVIQINRYENNKINNWEEFATCCILGSNATFEDNVIVKNEANIIKLVKNTNIEKNNLDEEK
jgi:sodium/potassium-transporting ATPase subunit alpha